MKGKLFVFVLVWVLCGVWFLSAENSVRISQIDSRTLPINQQVKAYISVTDRNGIPVPGLSRESFSVLEMSGAGMTNCDILSFHEGVNVGSGIAILFVVDNSGSMYWDSSGRVKNSPDEKVWRITFAKEAVLSLLKDMKNPEDRAGVLSFNVKIQSMVRPTKNKVEVERALMDIRKPSEEEAYTELYEALYKAVDLLRTVRGRKVIILLSDGQNFPLKENPFFPERHGMEGAIDYALHEGISIFAIGLSDRADRKNLGTIARETGGSYFSVYNPNRLASLYFLIRQQVMGEYLITFRAAMGTGDKRLVRVEYTSPEGVLSAQRYYYSGSVLGSPQGRFDLMVLLAIPMAAVLMIVLAVLQQTNTRGNTALTVYRGTGKRKRVQTLRMDGRDTVTISARGEADLTITGDANIGDREVKIEKYGEKYRVSGTDMTVNNRPARSRMLRPGDCITIGSTSIVFDEGSPKKKGKK